MRPEQVVSKLDLSAVDWWNHTEMIRHKETLRSMLTITTRRRGEGELRRGDERRRRRRKRNGRWRRRATFRLKLIWQS